LRSSGGVILGIIVKFIITNIKEKKFRTFLIVFSITISTALFLSSRALMDTMLNESINSMKSYYGDCDIIISADEDSPSWLLYTKGPEEYKDEFEHIVGTLGTNAVFKSKEDEFVRFDLRGINLEDQDKLNPITYVQTRNLYPFSGKKIIVNSDTAQRFNLNLGDSIELEIDGIKRNFIISGIAENEGFFQQREIISAIVPKSTLASFFNADLRVSAIYLKLKDISKKNALIKELSKAYKQYYVSEPFTEQEIKQALDAISTPFTLIVVIIMCTTMFIIYSSFKVITLERLQVIGTFRSIGATRKATDFILIAESLVYGTIGGITGIILGIGVLYLMKLILLPNSTVVLPFTLQHIISAFIFAILITLLSTLLPIIRVSKIPLRAIVLNDIEKKPRSRKWYLFIAIPMLILTVVGPRITPKNLALITNIILAIILVLAVVLIIPYVVSLFVKIFERLFVVLFGNIGILAAKNLKDNKSVLNNISLLAIGLSSLLTMNTVSHDVVREIVDHYKTRLYDIMLEDNRADKNFEQLLRRVDGVKDVYSIYETYSVDVEGLNYKIRAVQGVDKNKYLDYWDMDIEGDRQKQIDRLDEGRNILITNLLKDALGVKKGDEITLKLGNVSRTFKIIGFYNTRIFSGNCALVSERYLKSDLQARYYSRIYIKTYKDPVEVEKTLREKLISRKTTISRIEALKESEISGNRRLFSILDMFSIFTLFIGVLGIFNNLIVSFLERKRSFAMFRSIGMSKSQILKMLFLESLCGGIIGGIMGVATGIIMVTDMPYVMKSINQPIEIKINGYYLFIYFIVGIIITVLASVAPAMKTSKLNIIEAIKYE